MFKDIVGLVVGVAVAWYVVIPIGSTIWHAAPAATAAEEPPRPQQKPLTPAEEHLVTCAFADEMTKDARDFNHCSAKPTRAELKKARLDLYCEVYVGMVEYHNRLGQQQRAAADIDVAFGKQCMPELHQ